MHLAVEEAGTGTPFLWGHGLTSSRRQEDEARIFDWSGLTDRFRVIRYDARGHGESDATANPDDYAYPLLGADALALATALGVDRFVAGGASMGSATALHAAVQAPERIVALVLLIPPTAWETRPAQRGLYEEDAHFIEEHGLEAFADRPMREPPPPIFADVAEALAEGRRANALGQDVTTLPAVLRGVARSDVPPKDSVGGIQAPALILAWPDDPGHPTSTAEALHELLERSELEVALSLKDVLGWRDRVGEFLDQAV